LGEHNGLKNENDTRKALRQARQQDQEHKMVVASSWNKLPIIQQTLPSPTFSELLDLMSTPTESETQPNHMLSLLPIPLAHQLVTLTAHLNTTTILIGARSVQQQQ
jgi:hypothetical protein